LSAEEAQPGESLNISVNAKPNSYVGLLGVDQSVLLLKKGNDIEKSTIDSENQKYNEAEKYNYKYFEGREYGSYPDFNSYEIVMLTNAKKPYCKFFILKIP